MSFSVMIRAVAILLRPHLLGARHLHHLPATGAGELDRGRPDVVRGLAPGAGDGEGWLAHGSCATALQKQFGWRGKRPRISTVVYGPPCCVETHRSSVVGSPITSQ